jgi:hypothetical protein
MAILKKFNNYFIDRKDSILEYLGNGEVVLATYDIIDGNESVSLDFKLTRKDGEYLCSVYNKAQAEAKLAYIPFAKLGDISSMALFSLGTKLIPSILSGGGLQSAIKATLFGGSIYYINYKTTEINEEKTIKNILLVDYKSGKLQYKYEGNNEITDDNIIDFYSAGCNIYNAEIIDEERDKTYISTENHGIWNINTTVNRVVLESHSDIAQGCDVQDFVESNSIDTKYIEVKQRGELYSYLKDGNNIISFDIFNGNLTLKSLFTGYSLDDIAVLGLENYNEVLKMSANPDSIIVKNGESQKEYSIINQNQLWDIDKSGLDITLRAVNDIYKVA